MLNGRCRVTDDELWVKYEALSEIDRRAIDDIGAAKQHFDRAKANYETAIAVRVVVARQRGDARKAWVAQENARARAK